MKSKGVAYLLWFFFGWLSAHRFYVGKTGSAILYLFTFQLLGIGWIIDLFLVGGMVDNYNLRQSSKGNMNQQQNVVVNVVAPTPSTSTN